MKWLTFTAFVTVWNLDAEPPQEIRIFQIPMGTAACERTMRQIRPFGMRGIGMCFERRWIDRLEGDAQK